MPNHAAWTQWRMAALAAFALPLTGSCDQWPRFDNLPDNTLKDPDQVPSLVQRDAAVEGPNEDFPDSPLGLQGPAPSLDSGTALRWLGGLGWGQGIYEQTENFGCAGLNPPLPLAYTGDVDFFFFEHQGGSLCLFVQTPLDSVPAGGADPYPTSACPEEGLPQWEMPLWAYDPEQSCATGEWKNRTKGIFPQPASDGPLYFGYLEPGVYTGMVAAVCGRYGPAMAGDCGGPPEAECVPYNLFAARMPSQAACDTFYRDLTGEGN